MKKYFYASGKDNIGPLSFNELLDEKINQETLIWFDGLNDWTPAKNIEKLREILELCPPPVQFSDNNFDNKNTSKIADIEPDDKPLLKNLPFMIIAPTLLGIYHLSQHQSQNISYIIGYFLGHLIILMGLPLLVVRIVKWLSKNKRWDKKATKAVWYIHLAFVLLSLIGIVRMLLYR